MSVTGDLNDEELTLFKRNFKEINILELKISKLFMAKWYDTSNIHKFCQQMDQAEDEIIEVLAQTTMQNCMQKIESYGKSSRAVDVFLQLSLDLVKKQIKHCQEVQVNIFEEESENFERKLQSFENKKIEIVFVLNDTNHPKRDDYLFEMVENIAQSVAKLLVNETIDDDELKVALCIFELQYEKLDLNDYLILGLKLSKGREPYESIAHKNILDEISNLEMFGEVFRESVEFRSRLRTIQRLTNGNCTQVVDVRLMMLIQKNIASYWEIERELVELSRITDLAVNKDELVTAHEHFQWETNQEIFRLEEILTGNDIEERRVFNDGIFKEVTKLNDEEIELFDKIFYQEEIHEKTCPVCFDEHTYNALLVSLKCPCKRERLCQSCASRALKEKSQCPCCRAYV